MFGVVARILAAVTANLNEQQDAGYGVHYSTGGSSVEADIRPSSATAEPARVACATTMTPRIAYMKPVYTALLNIPLEYWYCQTGNAGFHLDTTAVHPAIAAAAQWWPRWRGLTH